MALLSQKLMQANTALVRTVQRLSVGFQDYLQPHNFTVRPLDLGEEVVKITTQKGCVTIDHYSEVHGRMRVSGSENLGSSHFGLC